MEKFSLKLSVVLSENVSGGRFSREIASEALACGWHWRLFDLLHRAREKANRLKDVNFLIGNPTRFKLKKLSILFRRLKDSRLL
jgi:hypothetical protein